MNTVITIKVITDAGTVAGQNAIEKAFGQFERIVKLYSRFDEQSELSKLNRSGGKWFDVSEEFSFLIGYMLSLAKATNGVYDPTIIDILEAYGYSAKKDFDQKLNDPDLTKKIADLVANRPKFSEIELEKQRVKLAPNQRLDLGGIGKGYAIDCAAAELFEFSDFLIDAGGDIRVQGNNLEGKPWQLGLKHKFEDQEGYLGQVELTSGSLCASGSWARRVGNFHHIIDPQSGNPHNESLTAYTYAKTALLADSWCTPLFLFGKVDKLPNDVAGMIIDKDNNATIGKGFPEIKPIANDQ